MKNFQQNLLIILALSLCGLCVYQWYGQTLQRNQIQKLNQMVYEQGAAIQGYTNSIADMDRQIAQMDARITALKESRSNQRAGDRLRKSGKFKDSRPPPKVIPIKSANTKRRSTRSKRG